MNNLRYIFIMVGLLLTMVAQGGDIYLFRDRQGQNNQTLNLSDAFFVARLDDPTDPIGASFSKLEKELDKRERRRLPMTPNLFWVCVIDQSGGRARVFSINLAQGLLRRVVVERLSEKQIVIGKEDEKENEAFLDDEFSRAVLAQYKKNRPQEWGQLVEQTLKSTGKKLEGYLGL